jgi:hypothetical protein
MRASHRGVPVSIAREDDKAVRAEPGSPDFAAPKPRGHPEAALAAAVRHKPEYSHHNPMELFVST